jgi:hypothetical protein
MSRLKRVAGIGLVALLLGAGLISVPVGNQSGAAYAGGGTVVTDPDPAAGDPDGPTGDIAPPTHGKITAPAQQTPPAKRWLIWSTFKQVARLWIRFPFAR